MIMAFHFLHQCNLILTSLHPGSAAALAHDDEVFAQYREVGVLLWRGFTVQQVGKSCSKIIENIEYSILKKREHG